MHIIFNLTLPFFAVIALGALAVRLRMVDSNAVSIINVFVFNFAMPALVGGALAKQSVETLINSSFLIGWTIAGLIVFAVGVAVSRYLFAANFREMVLSGQASAVGNVGFLGFPLLAVNFGDDGLRVASSALLVDLLLLIPLSICLLEAAGGGTMRQMMIRIIKGALLNPFIFAIFVGFTLSASGWGLAGPIDRFVSFLGSAAGPTALFALGISLASRKMEGDLTAISILSLLKLVLHPLIAFWALRMMNVDDATLAIGVVIAALPVAGNVFVIAQQYNAMVRRCSSAILLSTIAAILTTAVALNFTGIAGSG